jgi:hypothetical protein
VTVQLVENKVKRNVGIEMVASRIVQIKMAETSCSIATINLKKKPIQLEDPWVSANCCAPSMAEDTAGTVAAISGEMLPDMSRCRGMRISRKDEI